MRITSAIAAAVLLSAADASTLTPPVLPLIVRNPYLSTWLANAREEPWTRWPMFYTGQSIGFSALASVPETSTVYPLFGRAQDSLGGSDHRYNISFPTYLGANYDASTTNLSYSIPNPHSSFRPPLELIISFLSPITPTSTLRQSIPASYVTFYVRGSFDVDIYIDVNGQWVSGNRGSKITWELFDTQGSSSSLPDLKTWKVERETEQLFTEWQDRAEWGALHFSGPSSVDHESGTSAILRHHFAKNGTLQNVTDTKFRSIMDEEPVFAFSKRFTLGSNHTDYDSSEDIWSKQKEDSVMFTIAHLQDPVTQFASARGLTYMRPLWMSYFSSDAELIGYHYNDFDHANTMAANYSTQLAQDAYKSGSDNYKDIVALTARQVLGATSFSGTADDPVLFLKEISSNGNSQTVDVIFPSWPFFSYTNPRWLAYLLEPLLEHMLSGQYPNDYTMHDLGTHFPNLTGHLDGRDEYMPVEECGDMLIMGLSLVHSIQASSSGFASSIWSTLGEQRSESDAHPASNDATPFALGPMSMLETRDSISELDSAWATSDPAIANKKARKWLSKSYKLWKQWTGYLVEFSLRPHNQLCTDDFAGWLALQTNLALKGIIGIRAMSEMASVVGNGEDAKYYHNISDAYIKQWEDFGMSRDYEKANGTSSNASSHSEANGRAKLSYDWYGSWTTLYSLFADTILCFHPTITGKNSLVTSPSPAEDHQAHLPDAQAPLHEELKKRSSSSSPSSSHDFIPHNVYKAQSSWYMAAMQKFGLPLDSRHLYTKSDWEFQAAAVAAPDTRKEILERVARWVNETNTDRPFSDLYRTVGEGGFPGPNFFARPVVGSHFAFLSLERSCGGTVLDEAAWA